MDYEELGEICNCSESCKRPPKHMLLGRESLNKKKYTADIMFIGIGPNPNYNEKETPPGGRKVLGVYSKAGKVAYRIMNSVLRKQANVTFWLTNSITCSCPDSEVPRKEQFNNCKKWLKNEIAIINPKLFILFGGKTQKNLNVYTGPLNEKHGTLTSYYNNINEKSYPCILSFHFTARQKNLKWTTQEIDKLADKIIDTIKKI